MKLLLGILLFIGSTGLAQDNVLNVFDDQIEAFNNQDIKRLVNNLDDDFVWYAILKDSIYAEVEGKEAFEKSMKGYFKQFKDVSTEILSYSVDGNKVSFRERVYYTVKGEKKSQTSIGVYQIENGKITRVWYFYI